MPIESVAMKLDTCTSYAFRDNWGGKERNFFSTSCNISILNFFYLFRITQKEKEFFGRALILIHGF